MKPEKVKLEERYFQSEELKSDDAPYIALAKILKHNFAVNSIFDAGCRDAKLIKALYDLDSNLDINGCDYFDWTIENAHQDVKNLVYQHDLRDPLNVDKKYDIVTCFEVAEHIDKDYCDTFLNNLKNLSKKYVIITWSDSGGENDRIHDTHLQHLNPLGRNDVIDLVSRYMKLNESLTEMILEESIYYSDFLWYWRKSLTVWEV